MVVELISSSLAGLQGTVANMLAVLGAALLSVLAVSFFRGETTVFKTLYLVIIFVTGTIQPLLGVIAGIATLLVSHRRREWDQQELATLYSLVFFAVAYYYGLVQIPAFTIAG